MICGNKHDYCFKLKSTHWVNLLKDKVAVSPASYPTGNSIKLSFYVPAEHIVGRKMTRLWNNRSVGTYRAKKQTPNVPTERDESFFAWLPTYCSVGTAYF